MLLQLFFFMLSLQQPFAQSMIEHIFHVNILHFCMDSPNIHTKWEKTDRTNECQTVLQMA